MRILSKILAVLIIGIIAVLAASPLAANFVDGGTSNYIFLGVVAVTTLAIVLAPTGRRAWGRGCLIVGVLFIAMPLFMTALSAQIGSEIVTEAATSGEQTAATIGASIGGGLMVGASLFLGFILGAIFIITGLVLVLGGRREVTVIEPKNT